MREWIITNGIGGYASSTDFGGMNTRKYHGLLIGANNPPEQRNLILSKLDESIEINDKKYNLYTNDSNNTISDGYKYQLSFQKDIIPIYTYKVQNVLIEKSICMIYGKNAVAVIYKIMNQKAKTKFSITPIINFKDFHSISKKLKFRYVQKIDKDKLQIDWGDNKKINIGVKGSSYIEHIDDIFYEMHYKKEEERGFDAEENHAVPGTFEIELKPNEDKIITFICSLDNKDTGISFEDINKIDGEKVIESEVSRINRQIEKSELLKNTPKDKDDAEQYIDLVRKYIIASDSFIVLRKQTKLHTIIAGYPWFLDWGRDAFISFEGLLLLSKRYDIAKEVLLTFTNKIKKGLVPNGFSEYDGKPLYNSVDSSLLLFEAVNKYLKYTNDFEFVKENLYEKLKMIIDKYIDGIKLDGNNIYLDDRDYLIVSGTYETQNTWMDAKVDGKPVTPRNGKVVEINAMWYNALKVMQYIEAHYNKIAKQIEYAYIAKRCKKSFQKYFYNKDERCLFDVIGDDSIRPNQIFALSLSYPILDCKNHIAKETFITVTQKLLNKYGLKTLDSDNIKYSPEYKGNPKQRDMIYHQGVTWPWLLGPYYNALNNLIKEEENLEYKNNLKRTMMDFKINIANVFIKEMETGNTVNGICELYDSVDYDNSEDINIGKGAFMQAWSISEIFRILLDK